MADYPELNFSNDEDFDADRLNKAMTTLDLRIRAQEALRISYDEAVDTLNRFGLQRLNDAVQPVYDQLVAIAQLGAIFSTTSTSTATLTPGTKTFVIAAGDRNNFAPAAYLSAFNPNQPSQSVSGRTQSYDRSTGTLIFLADTVSGASVSTGNDGSGNPIPPVPVSVANWSIMASTDFIGIRGYVDAAVVATLASVASTIATMQHSVDVALTTINGVDSRIAAGRDAAIAAAASGALALAIALG